jgi:hypothetical protein
VLVLAGALGALLDAARWHGCSLVRVPPVVPGRAAA